MKEMELLFLTHEDKSENKLEVRNQVNKFKEGT